MVAYKLAWALAEQFSGGVRLEPKLRQFMLNATSLAAIGTVADIVDLRGENRVLTSFGLAAVPDSRLCGLRALIESAGLKGQGVDSYTIGFRLAPVLNAAESTGGLCIEAIAPLTNQIQWPTPTLPWVVEAFHGPAYSDTQKYLAALDLISYLGFSESSELYQKLVIQEQKVDRLQAQSPDRVDPNLFVVFVRVKKPADIESVRTGVLATLEGFKEKLVAGKRLEEVKRHLRYSFALSLNNSETIAGIVARYVALRRTPETINRVYDLYDRITPEDIQAVARKYLIESGRTMVTLMGGKAQ
jgi:hypothetical protein